MVFSGYQGQGFGEVLLFGLWKECFDRQNVACVISQVCSYNIPSSKLHEKLRTRYPDQIKLTRVTSNLSVYNFEHPMALEKTDRDVTGG